MLSVPQMLLIGATGRDAGKTTFACRVLQHCGGLGLCAAKVTVIQERTVECPRGGMGCGVCSSVGEGFVLTEELSFAGNKDTQRMLASGARRVYWLRTLMNDAEEGLQALLDALGPGIPFICESNSLRKVVVPGLFLMVANKNAHAVKDSARVVRDHADRVILSDGTLFDFNFDEIDYTGKAWRFQEGPPAVTRLDGEIPLG